MAAPNTACGDTASTWSPKRIPTNNHGRVDGCPFLENLEVSLRRRDPFLTLSTRDLGGPGQPAEGLPVYGTWSSLSDVLGPSL